MKDKTGKGLKLKMWLYFWVRTQRKEHTSSSCVFLYITDIFLNSSPCFFSQASFCLQAGRVCIPQKWIPHTKIKVGRCRNPPPAPGNQFSIPDNVKEKLETTNYTNGQPLFAADDRRLNGLANFAMLIAQSAAQTMNKPLWLLLPPAFY